MSATTLIKNESVDLTNLSPTHRRVIEEALELYMRVMIGQYAFPLEMTERKYPDKIGLAAEYRNHTLPSTHAAWPEGTPGIGNPLVHPDAKEAHDLRDHLRDCLRVRFGVEVLPNIIPRGNPDDQL